MQSSLTLERSREEISHRHARHQSHDGRVGAAGTLAEADARRTACASSATGRSTPGRHDPIFGPFDLTVHIGRLTSSATWDTRDDPSDSTRGTFVSTSLEHGTSRLGSDLLFLRSLTQAYHFRPWKTVVLASAARYGAVKPLEGQVLVSSSALLCRRRTNGQGRS